MADLEGRPVKIGEREFVVPKLRCGTNRRVSEIIEEIDGVDVKSGKLADTQRWFDGHQRAICELLRRNYPDLDVRDIEDLIDTDAVVTTFFAVLAASGKKADDPGEAASP